MHFYFDDSANFNPVVTWPVLNQISLDLIWTGTTANTRGDLQTPQVLDFALKIPQQVKIIPITMWEFTFYSLLWHFMILTSSNFYTSRFLYRDSWPDSKFKLFLLLLSKHVYTTDIIFRTNRMSNLIVLDNAGRPWF